MSFTNDCGRARERGGLSVLGHYDEMVIRNVSKKLIGRDEQYLFRNADRGYQWQYR